MSKDITSVVFTGDIGFDHYMQQKWEDKTLLSNEILQFFHCADHTVANVEGAVMDIVNDGSRGAYFHTMDPKAITVLNKIHADVWSIGNNHITDAGKDGVVSTKEYAAKNNVSTIGAGINSDDASNPVYLNGAGGIGLICTSYTAGNTRERAASEATAGVFRWDDYELIEKRILEIKSKCRWCIIVCHGGEEFTCLPSPYTRNRYIKYLELGADIVVAHHPHVTENYEMFDNGKAIFYSLGNFIFDTDYQRAHKYTDEGVLLKLIFTEKNFEFDAIGIKIERDDGKIVKSDLPAIFKNINADEYQKLIPLAIRAFIAEEKIRMAYLIPEEFLNATQEKWEKYFFIDKPYEYFENEHMDFDALKPYIQKAESGEWKKSYLTEVKNYILKLI